MSRATPLKIGLDFRYAQADFPGIGRYVYNLALALLKLETGQPFRLILASGTETNDRYNLAALKEAGTERLTINPVNARPLSPAEQWQLPRMALQNKVDLWHAPYYIRPYFLPRRSILTAYDLIGRKVPGAIPGGKARLAFEITTRLALLTSPAIITLSQSAANDLIELYWVNPSRITVIPPGVEAKFMPLKSEQKRTAYRDQMGLPENYILYVGINKPHKNLVRLLEAFKIFRQRNPDNYIELVLAGKEDPRYIPGIQAKISELGLEKWVRRRGEVTEDELIKFYSCARLLVQPSLYEGFGLPVLEGQACGVPVICANTSSLPEAGGPHVPLFDPYRVEDIAGAIERMLTDEPFRQHQIELGLTHARQMTWVKAAERTFELYCQIATRK